jgi:hypothetical protein
MDEYTYSHVIETVSMMVNTAMLPKVIVVQLPQDGPNVAIVSCVLARLLQHISVGSAADDQTRSTASDVRLLPGELMACLCRLQ